VVKENSSRQRRILKKKKEHQYIHLLSTSKQKKFAKKKPQRKDTRTPAQQQHIGLQLQEQHRRNIEPKTRWMGPRHWYNNEPK
jgi:hypothetical protein